MRDVIMIFVDRPTRRVLIIGYDGAELLDIACPSDVFDAANRLGATKRYELILASMSGSPIRCQSGLTLATQKRLDQVRGPLDTVLVAGGLGHEAAASDARLTTHLRRLAKRSRRVASVCTGATVLAAAGLLTGKRATTHWRYADRLAKHHPDIAIDPAPLYIQDGNVYTSAGVTSAIDLALKFVQDDNGSSLATNIARNLVTYLQRPGNQAQVSMFLTSATSDNTIVRELTDYISSNLDKELTTTTLARHAGMSTRQLSRVFHAQLGTTPNRYIRAARTEASAQLLVSTTLPLAAVARRCGFGSTETLRQAFLDQLATTPSNYRKLNTRSADPESCGTPVGRVAG